MSHLPARPLPALRELTLTLYDPFDAAEALERYIGELPALRQLTVYLHPSEAPVTDDVSDSDDSEDAWETRTEKRVLKVEQLLARAVAPASVQLEIVDETGI